MKTVRHYFMLGCYLGLFAAAVVLARALPELPGKLQGVDLSATDFLVGAGITIVLLAGIVLFCGLVGGLVGRLKLDAEKRARARKEALVVRR